jgi:hypothetical protein
MIMLRTVSKTSKKIISTIAVFGFALSLSTAVCSASVDKGPAEMVLKTAKAKKPASFPHAKHQEVLTCADCHHGRNEDGSQAPYIKDQKIQKCIICHNKKDMANPKLNSFKNSAHDKCKSCHKVMKKEGKATGPTKCKGCHNVKK